MKSPDYRRRAIINPVELVVFTCALGIFGYSGYQFFTDSARVEKALQAALDAPSFQKTGRKPASVTEHFTEIKISCTDLEKPIQTQATKVRLVLNSCPKTLKSVKISHTATRAIATVFQEDQNLSTDYVGVQKGENVIHIEGQTTDGSTFSHDLKVTKI